MGWEGIPGYLGNKQNPSTGTSCKAISLLYPSPHPFPIYMSFVLKVPMESPIPEKQAWDKGRRINPEPRMAWAPIQALLFPCFVNKSNFLSSLGLSFLVIITSQSCYEDCMTKHLKIPCHVVRTYQIFNASSFPPFLYSTKTPPSPASVPYSPPNYSCHCLSAFLFSCFASISR